MAPNVVPFEPDYPGTGSPSDGPGDAKSLIEGASGDATISKAVPASPSPPTSPSSPADTPTETEPDYVPTGDGYFYIRNADGSFQPQAYYQGPDGRYWPYEG